MKRRNFLKHTSLGAAAFAASQSSVAGLASTQALGFAEGVGAYDQNDDVIVYEHEIMVSGTHGRKVEHSVYDRATGKLIQEGDGAYDGLVNDTRKNIYIG